MNNGGGCGVEGVNMQIVKMKLLEYSLAGYCMKSMRKSVVVVV